MPQATQVSTVKKICEEAALFENKDRLLHFSIKNEFQTPLLLEAGDAFYDRWLHSGTPIPLDTFLPESQTFTTKQKQEREQILSSVFREKRQDFGKSDLYLLLGFLKWDGNALAPSLLVPIDVDAKGKSLTLSKTLPMENIVLRERMPDIGLPSAEDAIVNGQFSISLYFSLFEKAVSTERNWKFTRHGICLAFLNSSRLRLKKCMEDFHSEKRIAANSFLNSLLNDEGFQIKESVFDDADFDQIFNPTEHHFLYTTDSHTTKVTIDALQESTLGYAIQTLPGTQKMRVAANIVAETLAQGKSTLVVTRRNLSRQAFLQEWDPQFRQFSGPERDTLVEQVNAARNYFRSYYKSINQVVEPSNTSLTNVLKEFAFTPKVRAKFVDSIFQESSALDYERFNQLRNTLEQIVALYFSQNGITARKTFENVKVADLTPEKKAEIEAILQTAEEKARALGPLIELFEKEKFFPTGVYLNVVADVIELIRNNFDAQTPEFEDWDLKSSSWSAYQDTLRALPEAGDSWVRYHRQTSDIYTEDAIDENILSFRDEFAESLKTTLKGLSDRYRSSRRRLMKVLKNPKDVTSDAHLLDLIDTLLELQDNKRAYKDTAVLGNHLLGKDWLYEKSNWVSLNKKITYLYEFREKFKDAPQLDLMLTVLGHWHKIKAILPQLDEYGNTLQELLSTTRSLSQALNLTTPLESLTFEKWLAQIATWRENWNSIDSHIELSVLFQKVAELGCTSLVRYLQNPGAINEEIVKACTYNWAGTQIQKIGKANPELFAKSPKAHSQLSKQYRTLLDQFCNANFREVHAIADTGKLAILSIDEAFSLSKDRQFDTVILLDADCISVAEAIPLVLLAKKTILVGNPHVPTIEQHAYDAFLDVAPPHTTFFMENIMTATLRRGIPTRELWHSEFYTNPTLFQFANSHIYNGGIKQFPLPFKSKAKNCQLKVIADKVLDIAKAAVQHAEKHPGQTLGIIAFSEDRCHEIETAISTLAEKSTKKSFFVQSEMPISFYVKTPDRAVDRYRDVIFICAENEGIDKITADRKFAVCTTLARNETVTFITKQDLAMQKTAKPSIFWDWISYLQGKSDDAPAESHIADSELREQVMDLLKRENINAEESFSEGGIPVGPVVVDANNANRFLAVIEDDCTSERFRESVEDREYIRPIILRQLGWKVISIWTPFWYLSYNDETSHIVTTIAIEQSVAPPPPEESETGDATNDGNEPEVTAVPYQAVHPKIEGTTHDKPIAELDCIALIVQMKFYVDHEAPIHEEMLLSRLLELHHVDRAGPKILQALNDAIKQGCQRHKFIKTGKFFYSTKNLPVVLRDRSMRPDSERRFTYVSPEERALIPTNLDDFAVKQLLGLL